MLLQNFTVTVQAGLAEKFGEGLGSKILYGVTVKKSKKK